MLTSWGPPLAIGNLRPYFLGTRSSCFISLRLTQPLLSAGMYFLTSCSLLFKALLSYDLLRKVPRFSDAPWFGLTLAFFWCNLFKLLNSVLKPWEYLASSESISFFVLVSGQHRAGHGVHLKMCVLNSNQMKGDKPKPWLTTVFELSGKFVFGKGL